MFRFARFKKTSPEVQAIYQMIMQLSRNVKLYTKFNIADSPTLRYEMLMLHVSALFWRLDKETLQHIDDITDQATIEKVYSFRQNFFDFMFSDMEMALREMGTGDTGVAHKVKRMAQNLEGRNNAYAAAINSFIQHCQKSDSEGSKLINLEFAEEQNLQDLLDSLHHNVYPNTEYEIGEAIGLSCWLLQICQDLQKIPYLDILAAKPIKFTEAEEVEI